MHLAETLWALPTRGGARLTLCPLPPPEVSRRTRAGSVGRAGFRRGPPPTQSLQRGVWVSPGGASSPPPDSRENGTFRREGRGCPCLRKGRGAPPLAPTAFCRGRGLSAPSGLRPREACSALSLPSWGSCGLVNEEPLMGDRAHLGALPSGCCHRAEGRAHLHLEPLTRKLAGSPYA